MKNNITKGRAFVVLCTAGMLAAGVAQAADTANLPAVSSLTNTSDYTVFMKDGVPEDVKIEALRKLWRSDPIFSQSDGLTDYGDEHAVEAAPVKAAAAPSAWTAEVATPNSLPTIESLGRDSDYRVFMKEGVPEGIRILALHKLWHSDPIFNERDGLTDYGDDDAVETRPVMSSVNTGNRPAGS